MERNAWPTRLFGELTENCDSKRIPVREVDRRHGPYPYYGASGIVDYIDQHIFDGEFLLIGEDGENLRSQKMPIAFLARGKFWVNNHAHVVRGNTKATTRFLLYALLNTDIKPFLSGTTMPKLTQENLNRIPLQTPPLDYQQAIVEVLGSLDDKIDCNRRINDLLLNMARALFQHWFVDFGPFRKRGLQNSDIGPIPQGWAAGPILDCCTLMSGGTPKTSVEEYWSGDILWASAKDVSQCGAAYLLDTERRITRLGVENSATQILPQGTVVIIARGATTGKFAALGRDMAMNQTCYGLRGKDGFSQEWVYLMLADVVPKLQQAAHGTIFDTITTTTFQTTNIVVPPRPVLDEFSDKVKPLFDQILANLKENQILAQTRDYLLPKLLSGKVAVKAAEKEMEAVA